MGFTQRPPVPASRQIALLDVFDHRGTRLGKAPTSVWTLRVSDQDILQSRKIL